jgi:hypothetical protein
MHDRAAQKAILENERLKGGGEASMDWINRYDPVAEWDKPPVVPEII